MAIFDLHPQQLLSCHDEVIDVDPEFATAFRGFSVEPDEPIMEPSSRPSYVIANNDWPAVQTLQSDEAAYQALVASFHRVDDATYNAAMAALEHTQTPPGV